MNTKTILWAMAILVWLIASAAMAEPGKGKGKGHGHDDSSTSFNSTSISGAAAGAESNSAATASGISRSHSVSTGTGGAGGDGGSAVAAGGEGGAAEANVTNNVSLFGGGSDGASATSGAGGGTNILSQTNINNPDDIKIRNTPDARAPFANSTGNCIIGRSAGLSVPGFGGSVGGGIEDKGCTRRETAMTMSNLGVPAMGLWLMCRAEDVERAGITPEECDAMIVQFQELSMIDVGYETVAEEPPGK